MRYNRSVTFVQPVTLTDRGVRVEPLSLDHVDGLEAAAADGQLWRIRLTSVPEPGQTLGYVEAALAAREDGTRFPLAIVDDASGRVLGTTSFHDILPGPRRLEIGYTWLGRSSQRTQVNTVVKRLLLIHAFEDLDCNTVGWRTDNFNHASQRAIERLGAKRDGVIRGQALRRDGTIRDTVMYSVTAGEWPEIRAHLDHLLLRHER